MIEGIHHIAIIVSSEKTVDFYKNLGFTEFFRKERAYDTIVLLEGYGTRLEIFIDPNHPGRATNPENLGLRHMAIKVDNIEETVSQFNLTIESIKQDWTGIRFAYIEDPDGLQIELHE